MCNHQFFIGRNHNGNGRAVGCRNYACVTEACLQVGLMVGFQTEEAQVAEYALADDVGVFADTAGEDEYVQTAGSHSHAADVFGEAVDEDVQGEFRAGMAFTGFFFDSAAVVGQAGQTE